MKQNISRQSNGQGSPTIPQPVEGKPGWLMVDTTWGKIQPIQAAEGVETIGELKVIEHLEKGLPIIDGRTENFFQEATLPGAKNIPYTEAADRIEELDPAQKVILFCNGPQCPQSPRAIHALLENGFPKENILYYRGGMHDWMTLGLPINKPSSD